MSFAQTDSTNSLVTVNFNDTISTIPSFPGLGQCIIDSLICWNYDIVFNKIKKSEIDPICRITFYRNISINDSAYKDYHENEKLATAQMTFDVYPISQLDTLNKIFHKWMWYSDCVWPNSGPDIYYTESFIFYDYTFCKMCSTNGNKKDLCRGNISKILSSVRHKKYSKFDDLLNDLPITRKKKE